MIEYTWSSTDSGLKQGELPDHHLPTRFALTMTAVIRHTVGSTMCILLCNPHPESWNNWLLPYGSLQVTTENAFTAPVKLERVGQFLKELRLKRAPEYWRVGREQIANMLGVDVALPPDPFFENFSVKFSKTANAWTAYVFAYHLSPGMGDLHPRCQTTVMPLDAESVASVLNDGKLQSLPVAENVTALIAIPQNLAVIRGER